MKEEKQLSLSSLKGVEPNSVLILKTKRLQNTRNCGPGTFLQHMQSLDRTAVPKHIITLDEKYLRRCLELVYASVTRGTSLSSFHEITSPLRMSTLPESRYYCDLSGLVTHAPFEAGIIGNAAMSMNLQKHPLDRRFGLLGNDIIGGRTYPIDATELVVDPSSSSSMSSISFLQNPEKKAKAFKSERFHSETGKKRLDPVLSTSTVSEQSSSLSSGNLTSGMLRVTWNSGLPGHIFSLDNHSEVYIANVIKPYPPIDDADFIYTFHTKEAYLVGKMRVSTSFKVCSNNSEIKETEFVLFGEDNGDFREETSMRHNARKSRGLLKKMSEVFNTSHPSREEGFSKKPIVDLSANFSGDSFLPNLELAAIVVKHHVCGTCWEPEVGGWGMKFLKKIKSRPCDSFVGNNADCSTSTDIIIPAGLHGGPRSRIDGPFGLVKRWRSGGTCDCGGWDIGCPITVLNASRSREETSPPADTLENCQSWDLHTQGSTRGSVPTMKMVDIQDGLYAINFRPTISALQSLSIAVAMIHTQKL